MPKECDLVAASALPVAYGTSHVGLVHRARLHAGQVGGSSCFSCQSYQLCIFVSNYVDENHGVNFVICN